MRRKRLTMVIMAVMAMGLAATGCEDNDGPMEELGESVDEAIEDAGDAVEDATDN